MNRIAVSLLVLVLAPIPGGFAQEPKSEEKNAGPPGWSVATEGSGIPSSQKASDYSVGVDGEGAHGGKAAMRIRSVVEKPTGFRTMTQLIKADAYRGKRVRLAGYLKTQESEFASIWLRVDGPNSLLGFDNMDHRPVKGTTDWTRYEVVLDVPDSAMRLAFGALLMGRGQVWADDLTLDVVDPGEVKSTQLIQYTNQYAEHASNLDFEATDGSNSVPGWYIHSHGPESYSHRIAESGAHGGRTFLEAKSTEKGIPLVFSAAQNISAVPYRSKRIRFRAYLKTESAVQEAYPSLEVWAKSAWIRTNASGRGAEGTTDWQPQEIVIDVPADAEILGLGIELWAAGAFGVDDVSVEVVDPSKVALSLESETIKTAREKRNRELAEAYPGLPDRPENLDFER